MNRKSYLRCSWKRSQGSNSQRLSGKLNHILDELFSAAQRAYSGKRKCQKRQAETLKAERKISLLNNDYQRKRKACFLMKMRIDVETEKKINEFLDREEITANAERQFVISVKCL